MSDRNERTSPCDLGVVLKCFLDSLQDPVLDRVRVRVAEETCFLQLKKEKRTENNVRKEDMWDSGREG